jgi:hypothetical protein
MDKYNSYRKCRLKIEALHTMLSHEYSDIYIICESDFGTDAIFNASIQSLNALSAHLYYLEKLEDK